MGSRLYMLASIPGRVFDYITDRRTSNRYKSKTRPAIRLDATCMLAIMHVASIQGRLKYGLGSRLAIMHAAINVQNQPEHITT